MMRQGKFEHLRSLFSKLKEHASSFGYELTKCHLVVKPGRKEKAAVLFKVNEVDFIDGHCLLGSFNDTSGSQKSLLEEKATEHVSLTKEIIKTLLIIAPECIQNYRNDLTPKTYPNDSNSSKRGPMFSDNELNVFFVSLTFHNTILIVVAPILVLRCLFVA